MNTVDYLEEVKKKHNIESDYKLAQHLKITRAAISRYRNYDAHMDNFACYKIAESLEINPHKVLIDIALEKERKEEKREFWKQKLKDLKIVPSIFLVSIITFSAATPIPAEAQYKKSDSVKIYIM